MPVTRVALTPTMIEHARILDVDIGNYTVTVTTEYTKKPLTGVSWASPYQHFENGEGIYAMPEVGSVCWLCEPSDGSMPFVIAWAPAQSEGDFTARKQQLNPGDIYLGTRDENFLILRRGGVVQIGGGPLSQRMFIQVNNTIKDLCENYSLQTVGGDLEWTVQRTENDTDGKRPTTLTLSAKQKANDQDPSAILQIGSHDNDQTTILSLTIMASGAAGAATQIQLKLGNDGTVQWTTQSDVTWTSKGKYSVSADGDVSLTSNKGDFSVTSSEGNVNISAGQQATMKGTSGVTLDAPLTKVTQNMQVGGGSEPVALATPLLIWLGTHTHLIPALTLATGPAAAAPTGPPPPSIVSQALISK